MTAVDALARLIAPDDPRSADQRRADAVVQMALDCLHGTGYQLPREHGMRPAVQVSVALSTLLGLDEQPGELAGHGPIPAAIARRIAADPHRHLAPADHRSTRPAARLRPFDLPPAARPHRARHRPRPDLPLPHCNRQARHCEIDHKRAWADGGPTNETNLLALCSRHHHGKHEAGWTPTRQPDGSIEWTAPTRHTYVKEPATYPIDHTTDPPTPTDSGAVVADPDPPPF